MATLTEAASRAARFLEQPKRMLIEGERVEARHGRTLESASDSESAAGTTRTQ
jgi:hypothetical protein